MVLPAIIAGAAVIGGGLMSYMSGKEGQKLNAAERARIQELIDKVQQPNFDWSQLTPEDYQLAGTYAPQSIPFIEQAAPELVKQSDAAKQGQQAQLMALQRLMNVGNSSTDIAQQAAVSDAARGAAIQGQGTIGALNEQMARQGGAPGSGLQYASALSQLQAGNQQGAMTGQAGALDAYRNRLQALRDSATIGSGIQGNENQLASQNASILNDYNTRMAQARQANVGTNVGNMNQAQQTNLQAKQAMMDQNVSQRNAAQQYNQENFNKMQQQQYQNQLDKIRIASGQSQANQQANTQQAQTEQNLWGGLGQAAGGIAQSFGGNNLTPAQQAELDKKKAAQK